MIARIKKIANFKNNETRAYLNKDQIINDKLTNAEFRILAYLLTFGKKDKFSQKLASEELHLAVKTISNALKKLQQLNFLEIAYLGDRYIYTLKV